MSLADNLVLLLICVKTLCFEAATFARGSGGGIGGWLQYRRTGVTTLQHDFTHYNVTLNTVEE
jgi:hypothetical protein